MTPMRANIAVPPDVATLPRNISSAFRKIATRQQAAVRSLVNFLADERVSWHCAIKAPRASGREVDKKTAPVRKLRPPVSKILAQLSKEANMRGAEGLDCEP